MKKTLRERGIRPLPAAQWSEVAHVVRNWAIQYGYVPNALALWAETNGTVELVSYPWWDSELERLLIHVRTTIGDPTTITAVEWPNLTLHIQEQKEKISGLSSGESHPRPGPEQMSVMLNELLRLIQGKTGRRIAIVTDEAGVIYVWQIEIETVVFDGDRGLMVYECDDHLGKGTTLMDALFEAANKVRQA